LAAFPVIERFALSAQLRRAAYSVAANIVEGFARPPGRGRLNFLNISKGSLAEVGYCVHVANRLGYLSDAVAGELENEIRQAMAPLVGVIRAKQVKIASAVGAIVLIVSAIARFA